MLTRQSWIALGVALVLGLVAVYIANVYLNGKQNQAALGGTTKIAVAAVPMDYGNDITRGQGPLCRLPQSQHPGRVVHDRRAAASGGPEALRPDADRRQRADPHNQDFRRRTGRLDRRAAARGHARRDGPHQRRLGRGRLRPAERQRRRADHPADGRRQRRRAAGHRRASPERAGDGASTSSRRTRTGRPRSPAPRPCR